MSVRNNNVGVGVWRWEKAVYSRKQLLPSPFKKVQREEIKWSHITLQWMESLKSQLYCKVVKKWVVGMYNIKSQFCFVFFTITTMCWKTSNQRIKRWIKVLERLKFYGFKSRHSVKGELCVSWVKSWHIKTMLMLHESKYVFVSLPSYVWEESSSWLW